MRDIQGQVKRVHIALESARQFLKEGKTLEADSMVDTAMVILDLSVIPSIDGVLAGLDYDEHLTHPVNCTCGYCHC